MNGSGANVAGCATCRGRCCRAYRVVVTAADVRTLSRATAMHPSDFIRLREGPKGFRLRRTGPQMELNLIRRQDTGGCVFLIEIASDVARCGVYAHRPLVCSNFPTNVERGVLTVRSEVTCGPNAWNLATMDLPYYRRGQAASAAAWAEHWQLVEAWNATIETVAGEASPEELFEYIISDPSGHPIAGTAA